jgi:DNA-binding CsgD family transcriptional regulator
MRRYVALTPAIPLVASNPGVKLLATRFSLPVRDEELHRMPFFKEIMQAQGWRHGAVLCFWPEPPGAPAFPVLVLSVYRTEDSPDFSDHELAQLERLHAWLAPAVARFHEISASKAVADGMAMALGHLSDGVVVLDWQLRTVHSNVAGRRSCAAWDGPPTNGASTTARRHFRVPASLLQACRALREEAVRELRHDRDTAIRLRRERTSPHQPGLTASVTVTCETAGIAEPSFIIEFHAGEPPAGQDTRPELTRLTTAERDVALAIADGLSNDEAADRLGKSIHAVKFLLHRVYRKLQVHNRTSLSRLLDGRARP